MLDKTQRGNPKIIRKLQYIGAMHLPGGGRNDVPNRLKKQFFIFNMVLLLSGGNLWTHHRTEIEAEIFHCRIQ
jgi:hypothetical protein